MEHYGGRPLHTSEIEPLEEEAYVALAVPMLNEIISAEKARTNDGPVAIEYLRVSDMDDVIERVGVIITDNETTRQRSKRAVYDITILHYKEHGGSSFNDKDSIAYKITDSEEGVKCSTDAMYADGMCIGQHQMAGIEHEMLLDELLAVHRWQLAAAGERDILNR